MSFGIQFPPSISSTTSMVAYRISQPVTLAGAFVFNDMPLTPYYSQGSSFGTYMADGIIKFTQAGTYQIVMNSGGSLCEETGSAIWCEFYDASNNLLESSSSTFGQSCAGGVTFTIITADVDEYIKLKIRNDATLTTSTSNYQRYQVVVTKLG